MDGWYISSCLFLLPLFLSIFYSEIFCFVLISNHLDRGGDYFFKKVQKEGLEFLNFKESLTKKEGHGQKGVDEISKTLRGWPVTLDKSISSVFCWTNLLGFFFQNKFQAFWLQRQFRSYYLVVSRCNVD